MASFRKVLLGAGFVAMTATLGGCESMDTAMRDVKSRFSSLDLSLPQIRSENRSYAGANEAMPEQPPEETALRAAAVEQTAEQAPERTAENCPPVSIVEELASLHQFENPERPSPETRISSVTLSGLKTTCIYNQNNVVVDMELRFDGAVGPRARIWNTDRPTFAYPYFMAITTQNGSISAKEVFAATISYNKEQDHRTHTENLRQIIPFNSDSDNRYAILIGFQLTEGELAYNRALKNAAAPAESLAETLPETEEPAATASAIKKATENPLLITPPRKPQAPAKTEEPAAAEPQTDSAPVEPASSETAETAATPPEIAAEKPAAEIVAPETVEIPAVPAESPQNAATGTDIPSTEASPAQESVEEDASFDDITAE